MRIIIVFLFISNILFSQRLSNQDIFSYDNNNQFSWKHYDGFSVNFDSINTKLGISGGFRFYKTGSVYNYYNDMKITTLTKYKKINFYTNISFVDGEDWKPIFYDYSVSRKYKKITIELSGERETIGTFTTNNNHFISNTNGLSIDYKIKENLIIVGNISYNHISNGIEENLNKRLYNLYRLVYSKDNYGFFDTRFRIMRFGIHSDYYFSPTDITQFNIGWGYPKLIFNKKWIYKFYVGLGIQNVSGYKMGLYVNENKLISNSNKRLACEISLMSTNFNEYIYNTLTLKLVYTLKPKVKS